ncbi:MAG: immunoglobulin domain-containing protein [Cytophagaceae bacterium]|nr:immunoglobulin domain-containing protein [Cytophagaceae bacterium]
MIYKTLKSLLIVCLLNFANQAKAQTVVIPDPNFKQFLIDNHPLAMNMNGELILLNAALILNLNCISQPINDFTGLQYLTGLQTLTINNTPATQLPSLGNMASLLSLNCSGNQLTWLPDLSSNLLLTSLDCSDNNLESLPNLSLHVALVSADFSNNKLTFEDFLPSMGNPIFNTGFVMQPQDSIAGDKHLTANEGSSFSYALNTDLGVSSNEYTWYKDGTPLSTNPTSDLHISEVKKSDAGTYYCRIINSNVPSVTLVSVSFYLEVKDCGDKCFKEITPDGDGINDSYYISDQGTAKIFDKNGVMVKKLSTPATWDGSLDNGSIGTTGLYLIEINGEKHTKIYLFK